MVNLLALCLSINKKYSCLLFFVFGILLFFSGNGCNTIDDSFTLLNTTLTNNSTSTTNRRDTVYLFETEGRHSVLFGGLRSCTLSVDGKIVSDTTDDSIYFRISHIRDTLLKINDTISGRAVLTLEDIDSWKTVLYHFANPDMYLFGKLFSDFMDTINYKSIAKLSDTVIMPSQLQQNIIIETMNKIVQYHNLFYDYREDMWMEMQIEEEDNFNRELKYLIDRGLMLDTTGEIKTGKLSEMDSEALRWFNLRILIRFFDLSPEAGYVILFRPHTATNRFSLMHFQRGNSLGDLKNHKIERILNTRSSGFSQITYSNLSGNFRDKLQIENLSQVPFQTNSNWQITSLFWPNIPTIPLRYNDSIIYPGQAYLKYDEKLSNFDTFYYILNIYYLLNGTIVDSDGIEKHIFGSIKIAYFFKFLFAEFNSSKRGVLTGYTSDICIQKNSASKKSHYQEKIRMKVANQSKL